MGLTIGATELPVIARVDAVVAGGSFAGLSCALELAKAGRRVMVIEPRTYLGRELTATLRPWLESEEDEAEPPELIRRVLRDQDIEQANGGGNLVPLHPDRLKSSLEELLEERGIGLLYASLPVGVETDGGKLSGLVIANKSGRQLIRCKQAVDATETALLAALCGEDVSAAGRGDALYYRTLEFVGVRFGGEAPERLPIPAGLGAASGEARLRRGYRDDGHVFVEFAITAPGDNTLESNRSREAAGREIGMKLAIHLMQEVPAFEKAVLSASSHELYGPVDPRTLTDDGSEDGRAASAASADDAGSTPADAKTRQPGVWSLFLPALRDGSPACLDARSGTLAGGRLGRRITEHADGNAGQEASGTVQAAAGPTKPVRTDETGTEDPLRDVEVRIPILDGRQGRWPMERVSAANVPVLAQADILVAGGGSGGACASAASAREGMRTVLVDLNPGLGGTGTYGGVDSYWFGRKAGYAEKLQEAVLRLQQDLRYKGHKWNLEAKKHVLLRQALEAGVEPVLNAVTFGALVRGNRVCGAIVATRWGPRIVTAKAVIDATGDGDVAAFAGAEYVYGSEKDHTVMWYSLAQFQAPDKIQNNFTSMVDVSDVFDYTRAILAGRRRGNGCHDHGIYVATRESRHILGDTVMKLSDQLLHRKWPDVVNVHFSNHDVKGVSGADWVNVGLIPPNLEIEIPYSMLLPRGLEGLLLSGKAISATHDALPAIRMQADLENLGAAAALAAAAAVRGDTTPRAIDVAKLQARLAHAGLIPASILTRKLSPIVYRDEDLERLVDSLEADRPLYEYSNMRMNEVYRDPIPFVEVCSVGPRIVPFLERALPGAEGLRRIRIAQALAMLGSNAGVPVLIEEIMKDLKGSGLPLRTAEIMYVQLPPDHGAMPDAAYLLYSLAEARDKRSLPAWQRVADLLHPTEDDFKDTHKGLYYFVDAVCQGAERLGDPDAVPILKQLHDIPLLQGLQAETGYQPDYFLERRAMLELALGRALARCGSPRGYGILIAYVNDARSLLSKQALLQLERLSGRAFGEDKQAWRRWLEAEKNRLVPQPATDKLDVETNSETLLRRIAAQ